jgi:hypothetical protein
MENFKECSRRKLRFKTASGLLSVEQLWDLHLEQLDTLAVSLEKDVNEAPKKSFLVKTSNEDKIAKLKFDIVLDILNTRIKERDEYLEQKENKEQNEKILSLISEKQDESLKGKSIEELKAMLK